MICSSCGHESGPTKIYCDRCGWPLASAPVNPQGVQEASPAEGNKVLPAAAQSSVRLGENISDLWAPSAPLPVVIPPPIPPDEKDSRRESILAVGSALALTAIAFGIWAFQRSRTPEVMVPKLAARYLDALHDKDYATAWSMFSEAAKKNCSEADLRASRDETAWTWSNLRLARQEPGMFLFSYALTVAGSPTRDDFLLFIFENGQWTRPYNWTLLQGVEKAFDRGDPAEGQRLAAAAVEINSRDPMAWGYLCEAAYYQKSFPDVERHCAKALELARLYPSSISPKSLYHIHAIMADTYAEILHQPAQAAAEFGQMLQFPNISADDQCQIMLARARLYASISRPGEALADLKHGELLCTKPSDTTFINRLETKLRAP